MTENYQERPYQEWTVQQIETGWSQFRKQLAIWPTGAGKNYLASRLAQIELNRGGRVLFLAHRKKLLRQSIAELHAVTGIMPQLEQAENRASLDARLVVGSKDTFLARADRWPDDHFTLVFIDEVHHLLADGYLRVVMKFAEHAKVCGLTASPDRGDARDVREWFDNVAADIPLFDLIKQKFLAPISVKSIPLKIDLTRVKQTGGDFDKGELDSALLPYMDSIALSIKEHAKDRKTIVFLPLVATSKKFCEICNEHGLSARHVDGYEDDDVPDSEETLQAFHRNEFQVLCNAMLCVEGYNEPSISCVVNLRPTRSRPLLAQMIGRGTRLSPGKENLLVLDFLFIHERLSIIHPASLVAHSQEEADDITIAAFAKEAAGYGEQDLMELAASCRADRERKLREELERKANRAAKFISAEEFAIRHNNLDAAEYQPTMKWHEEKVTAKQSPWLEKAGINLDTVRDKGHASKLLDIYFKEIGSQPASNGQRWMMRQSHWVSTDGKRDWRTATRDDAKQFFAARNKKPAQASTQEELAV